MSGMRMLSPCMLWIHLITLYTYYQPIVFCMKTLSELAANVGFIFGKWLTCIGCTIRSTFNFINKKKLFSSIFKTYYQFFATRYCQKTPNCSVCDVLISGCACQLCCQPTNNVRKHTRRVVSLTYLLLITVEGICAPWVKKILIWRSAFHLLKKCNGLNELTVSRYSVATVFRWV